MQLKQQYTVTNLDLVVMSQLDCFALDSHTFLSEITQR